MHEYYSNSSFYAVILVIIVVFILALIICWGYFSSCNRRNFVFYDTGDVWRGSGSRNVTRGQECGNGEHIKTMFKIKSSANDVVCLDYHWKVMDCKKVIARGKKRFQGSVGRLGTLYLKEIGQSGNAVLELLADGIRFSYNGAANGSRLGDVLTMTSTLYRVDEDCESEW
jgi:hypothetical protein